MSQPTEPFDLVDGRCLAVAGFLSVHEERFRLANRGAGGTPRDPTSNSDVMFDERESFVRYRIGHPGAVAIVPFANDGETIFLVRQFRAPVRRSLLEIPAGKRDVAGEAPEVTAGRELEEEIGRRAGRLELLTTFYSAPGFSDEHFHLYVASELELVDEVFELKAEERLMRVEQWRLDDALVQIERGLIVDAKSIIGLMLAAARRPAPRRSAPR